MVIKTVSNIALVMWLILISVGITINKHYSNGELFSTRIFVEAPSCCEVTDANQIQCVSKNAEMASCCAVPVEAVEMSCCSKPENHTEQGCCDEESEILQLEEDYFPNNTLQTDTELKVKQIILLSTLYNFPLSDDGLIAFVNYGPSPPKLDLQQTFLLNENFRC